jgi:hypothetical protein
MCSWSWSQYFGAVGVAVGALLLGAFIGWTARR